MTKQILPNRWLIWAVVAIIVVGTGVWGYIQYVVIQDNMTENISVIPTAKTTEPKETSQLTTYLAYKNDAIALSFKYPSNALLVDKDEKGKMWPHIYF